MLVLGIETTCDETSCSIVRDGFEILSLVVHSQVDLHKEFGGVVPEIASRRHVEVISAVMEQALQKAGCTLSDIDLISVAKGPGLIGALLVGIHFAKGLSFAQNIPLIGVSHIEAHLYASMMEDEKPLFPSLGVVLSGGHTSLVLVHDIGNYELLGETIDDAVGEAFDKVAKILNLAYPGGPEIEKLAQGITESSFSFKSGKVKEKPLHFSLSGLKTQVLYAVQKCPSLSLQEKKEIAFSFQETVFQDVIEKIKLGSSSYPVRAIYFGGGVTQNKRLKNLCKEKLSLPLFFPSPALALDNAAMIAGLGFHEYKKKNINELFCLQAETRILWKNSLISS